MTVGATPTTETSGVAHYSVDDDGACLTKLRELVAMLPPQRKVEDTTGAEPDGRWAIMRSDGSTATTSRSRGSYEPAPAPRLTTLTASPRAR